jgi:CRISPR-associated endonuclease Cas1
MNALWITRFSAYKYSPEHIESAKQLIALKIKRQNVLLKKYHKIPIVVDVANCQTVESILLHEARAAKHFWHEFQSVIPAYIAFSRHPRAEDVTNQLLDVGYHHLTNVVKKILDRLNISLELGLLHVARTSKSAPLAYDLVEMFRSDVVDTEVLHFLRLKKQKLQELSQPDIAYFLHRINQRLQAKHYLKDFKQCHAYFYYMELQILKFCKAVNHRSIFEPMHLPTRHDTRCLTPEKRLL